MARRKLVEQKPLPLALRHDAMDRLMFDSISHARKINELCEDDASSALVQDSFTSMYSRLPGMAEKSPRLQRELLETMMKLPEYERLHSSTVNDEIASALGATHFAPKLIEQYREVQKKAEDRKKEQQDQGQGQGQDGDGDGPGLEDLLSDKEMSAIRQGMRDAMEEANDEADKWKDTCHSWGVQPGELREMPADKRMELADTLANSDELSRISELVGRFKNIVNSKSSTAPVHGYDEIVDIKLSDDIQHMLPNELVKLINDPQRFYVDFLEKKLMTYELKGVDEVGKGPIIVCLDISGSMAGAREEWGKAVTLALMRLAEKQKRSFGFLAFESITHHVCYFPKTMPIPFEKKLGIASIMTTGGTEFQPALQEAFRLRNKEPGLKPADIVFITDGECYLNDTQVAEINEMKANTDVRIYSISIEGDGKSLMKFSDQVSRVDMKGDITLDVVRDVVGKTASRRSV